MYLSCCLKTGKIFVGFFLFSLFCCLVKQHAFVIGSVQLQNLTSLDSDPTIQKKIFLLSCIL